MIVEERTFVDDRVPIKRWLIGTKRSNQLLWLEERTELKGIDRSIRDEGVEQVDN